MAYLHSPSFKGDVAESLCNYDVLSLIARSKINLRLISTVYGNLLAQRMVYRFAESVVSAACLIKGGGFGKEAVLHHYVYPLIQEHRFAGLTTRFLWRAVSWVLPRCLRGCLRLSTRGKKGDSRAKEPLPTAPIATSLWYATPTPERISLTSSDAIRRFDDAYRAHPLRTILSTGFIPDLARLGVNQALWGLEYHRERRYPTSRWRVLKPHLRYLACTGVETVLSYAVRAAGAILARRSSATSGESAAMFWGEHLLYLACFFPIMMSSQVAGEAVGALLERAFPASAEDLAQNAREREEEATGPTRVESWFRMEEEVGGRLGKDARENHRERETDRTTRNGSAAEAAADPFARFYPPLNGQSTLPDFYAVLGVDENAAEHQIKKAYHKLALQYHPDRVGSTAEAQHAARERMAVINDAYDTLSDSRKRMEYNRARSMMPMFSCVDQLENASAVQLMAMGLGIFSLMGAMVYMQFRAAFFRITSPGCIPLIFQQWP
ncbi:unnamed protein product [Phytomonas sp. EM1]|nr:unnamed protein product [Phytomonas sp. EM1]|eukprot:CCW65133.1 unnamed protein product [Phytomonas sp. isolate EM1]